MLDTLLCESIIDWTRESLDPKVFDESNDKYTLKQKHVDYLKKIISDIDQITHVNNAFIKGSILSFQWLDHTDIDLLIEIDPISEDIWRKLQDQVDEQFENEILPDTEHPLQIYLQRGRYLAERADGIYHLDDGWIKGPYDIKVDATLDDYAPRFNKLAGAIDEQTGKLKRDIIDYELMKQLEQSQVKGIQDELKLKLKEINNVVEKMVSQFKAIKDMRHRVFDEPMTPEEIVKYKTKNALPGNVIFKLLERFHILEMLYNLKTIFENGDKIKEDEVDNVRDSLDKY